jgi:hypothetical protein
MPNIMHHTPHARPSTAEGSQTIDLFDSQPARQTEGACYYFYPSWQPALRVAPSCAILKGKPRRHILRDSSRSHEYEPVEGEASDGKVNLQVNPHALDGATEFPGTQSFEGR